MKKNGFFSKVLSLSAAVALFIAAAPAGAMELNSIEVETLATVAPLNLINWKVGDTMNYQVSMGFFGKVGTMVKTANKDEGATIWLHQDINLQGQKEIVDVQFNKADAKVLKVLRNGKETQLPDDKIEVISQDYAQVTVPAGTFDTVHITAKSKQVSKIEMWANPTATALDGGVKQIMATQFGDMVLELTSFKRN
jgi:hypothetical protein